MPLRLPAFSIARFPVQRRLFQCSAIQRKDSKNHYETLQIPIDATPAEVKKSFYALSKTHHPDRNPNDPGASSRFVKITEAYSILGTPAKRQSYDREHMHTHSSSSHPHHRTGSYHSTSPAGGRPASGLSRRRTQFRGPPPSFYRSGGWGAHEAKRAEAQRNGAPGAEKPDFGENVNANAGGGMGYGHGQWGNDVPHFDKEGHFRTHHGYEMRRRERMGGNFEPREERGVLGQFLLLGGILFVGVVVPVLVMEKLGRIDVQKKRNDR